jgi:cobalamin biosynthesis protein CobT
LSVAAAKDIEQLMAARSQSYHVPGYRSGKVNAAALSRLRVGDDRVFRRKQAAQTKDTAVSLLIDCSGSMHSGDRIQTAMSSAYSLSQTLERVGIKHEVLGFTTKGHELPVPISVLNEEQRRVGKNFSRVEPLWIPIFKGWSERLSSDVKKRFANVPENMSLSNNGDGECVEIAAPRHAPGAAQGADRPLRRRPGGRPPVPGSHAPPQDDGREGREGQSAFDLRSLVKPRRDRSTRAAR